VIISSRVGKSSRRLLPNWIGVYLREPIPSRDDNLALLRTRTS
jgi:hypothetical protein